MRILDEQDQELQQEDLNLSFGYLVGDQILKEHHDAVPEIQEEGHYYPETFYFMDDTKYKVEVEGENDPHVKANEDGVSFTYIPGEREGEREFKGCDVKYIIDVEHQDAKEAYDEMEDIQRYKLYTEEQLRENAVNQANAERQEKLSTQAISLISFMAAPMTLEMTDDEVQNFALIMPDFIAGNEYENKAVVNYNGNLYRAIQAVPASVTQTYTPDQANTYWKRVAKPNEEGIYEWSQPYGATDCYQIGDKVTYQGKTYECTAANCVWAPGVYGWKEVGESGGGGSEEPEPPTEEYPDWVQPTGQHDAYRIGDKVTFKGKHYESVIDYNTWSPEAYPAGWKEV